MPLKVKKLTPAGAIISGRETSRPSSESPSPKNPRYLHTPSSARFSAAASTTAYFLPRMASSPSAQFTSAEAISSDSAQSSPKA